MSYRIISTKEYENWVSAQALKVQTTIRLRLIRVLESDHFGDIKRINEEIIEFRWKNGLRVYFSVLRDENGNAILLLIGGNKNSQSKDINQAKRLLRKYNG